MDFTLQLVMLPVSDVDKAKAFYADQAGFTVDVDHANGDAFRIVQLTPPGSACSIAFGIGVGAEGMTAGSIRGLHLCVSDIAAAREELVGRGVAVSEVRHMTPQGWQPGPDPEHARYNSFADFADPDGNAWVLQEVR
jgi:catechol 2,3-dioxygenase-like lactoylglutathione lyase family enzyme